MITPWKRTFGSKSGRAPARSRRPQVEVLEWRSLLSVSPVGSEYPVNTTTLNSQIVPATASDSAGDSVVVWESNQVLSNHYDIYGQMYDSSGAPSGSEFQIAATTVGSTGSLSLPSVAMDSVGDFVVVWGGPESSFLSVAGNIYGQRYDASGTPVGSQFEANVGATGGSQDYPSVAMDSEGDFIVAWESGVALGANGPGSGPFVVQAQYFNSSGVGSGPFYIPPDSSGSGGVGSSTFGDQMRPDVAMDSEGDFVITYLAQVGGFSAGDVGSHIMAALYNSSGTLQGSPIQVDQLPDDSSDILDWPAVAMDAEGDFAVTWIDPGAGGAVDARQFDNTGTALAGVFQVDVSQPVDNEFRPADIAMDPDGDFVITWSAPTTSTSSVHAIYASVYNSSGVAIASEYLVSSDTDDDLHPAVAMDGSGDFEIVWESDNQDFTSGHGNSPGIYGQRFDF